MSIPYSGEPAGTAPSIEIFSPIPPLRTGTAVYISSVLEYIKSVIGAHSNVIIAVDTESFDVFEPAPDEFLGFRVVDYRDLPNVPSQRSTRFYFTANNAYHAYIHRLISGSNSLAQGRIVTVVHDASVFMLSRHMFGLPSEELDATGMEELMRTQFAHRAKGFFESRLGDLLPMNVEYEIHCLGPVLENSHEVWVHSLFALSRLLLENDIPTERLPKLRLASHPLHEIPLTEVRGVGDKRFVIGVFGWVTEPKRIDAILHGLALAIQWLPAGCESRIVLRVVGRKPLDWDYHPARVAGALGIFELVEFIDYPDKDLFEQLQLTCDIILNLRYPSTGETSGTFATARMTGTPIVTSRYHAFHEIGVPGATVSSLPMIERWSIAEIIAIGFQRWCRNEAPGPAPREPSSAAPIEKLLLLEIAEKFELGRSTNMSRLEDEKKG